MFDLKLLKRIDWFTILLVVGLVTFGIISIASIMATHNTALILFFLLFLFIFSP